MAPDIKFRATICSRTVFYIIPLLILLFFLSFGKSANAKTIAVVMDDSGSMVGAYPTSLFALQSLATMISADDTLFVVKMSDYRHPIEITTDGLQNQLVKINTWSANGKTPFAAVEAALNILNRKTKPEEEAILLVLTDGDFQKAPVDEENATIFFRQFQNAFKGKSLRAFFVSLQTQENAFIRRSMLSTFNNHADEGDIVISKNADMLKTMRSVYASILGIQDDQSITHAIDKQTIAFNPPFPVTEIVTFSFDTKKNKLPEILDYPGGGKGTIERYDFQMNAADNITRHPLHGQTTHIKPWPSLQPGQEYRISFDQPINKKLHVLLKTAVSVNWSLLDSVGTLLHPVNGVYIINQNEPLTVRAWLESSDKKNNAHKVNLGTLPQLQVVLRTDSGQGAASQKMRAIANNTHELEGELVFNQPGKHRVSVAARYPGFIDIRARDIEIEVKKIEETTLTIEGKGTSRCPHCRPENLGLTYTEDTVMQPMLELLVAATSKQNGTVDIDLQTDKPLPAGVEIELPDGTLLDNRHSRAKLSIELNAKQPKIMTLQYNAAYQKQQEDSVVLEFSARKPWRGNAKLQLNLIPVVQPLAFLEAGTTLDMEHGKPFQLEVSSLDTGEGLYYKLQGLVAKQIKPEYLEIDNDSWRLNYDIAIENNHLLRVSPIVWWCDCFTRTGNQTFTLIYDNPETRQKTSIQGTVNITPVSWLERCWKEWLTIFLFIMIMTKLICIIRTHRFPRSSYVNIRNIRPNPILPPNNTYLHWDNWFWPPCKSEVTVVHGLRLKARKNGLELLSGDYGLIMNPQGTELLVEVFKKNKNKPLKMLWNSELSDGNTVYQFIKG